MSITARPKFRPAVDALEGRVSLSVTAMSGLHHVATIKNLVTEEIEVRIKGGTYSGNQTVFIAPHHIARIDFSGHPTATIVEYKLFGAWRSDFVPGKASTMLEPGRHYNVVGASLFGAFSFVKH